MPIGLAAHIEAWIVTTRGELVEGFPRHFIRINPTDSQAPDPHADPNTGMIWIANGGGLHPARNVVGGDFLQLVRLGIRDPKNPIVLDSIEVIDRVIKHDLPRGPCWRRYNYDGYGQKDDGNAFDGTGVGRSWPILTGERGHYELAAGRDPKPLIAAIENFAMLRADSTFRADPRRSLRLPVLLERTDDLRHFVGQGDVQSTMYTHERFSLESGAYSSCRRHHAYGAV
jgi:GH15 family glucan-1,4-alpha-glucosidase